MLSEDQVLALAPDQSSVKSGRELALAAKWQLLAACNKAVYGLCQGSGKSPYQTAVDLQDIAFKCNCPSRKFPCKHGLALLLLYSKESSIFEQSTAPEWLSNWLKSRRERTEKEAQKSESQEKTAPDPLKRAKTQSARAAKVEAGMIEFQLWLKDRIRQGLAGLESSSYQLFENAAARLSDAQAAGLARMLRNCAGIPNTGEGWQDKLLSRLALMQLLVEAYTNIEQLPEPVQHDLKQLVGFTVSQEELLQTAPVFKDNWQVLAQTVEIEDRLKTQRTWLRSKLNKRWALILNFAHGNQSLDTSLSQGTEIEAELCFFPGSLPLRALIKERTQNTQPPALASFNACKNIDEFLDEYTNALAANPFLETYPCAISGICCLPDKNASFIVVDKDSNSLPLSKQVSGWQILALTGGNEFSLFGQWNSREILPLSMIADGQYQPLSQRQEIHVV